jgi:hypothetical protein
MSTAYHPQSDGKIECVNQCLETFLRCFVNACPNKWIQWLSLAEYWYNTSYHTTIDRSPFDALYGHPPHHFGISGTDSSSVVSLDHWPQESHMVDNLIKQHLNRASLWMKQQADKGCSECQFLEGEVIFLKLQPYIQPSLAPRANQKLTYKFFLGPFRIIQKLGKVAYKLELPLSSSIHPEFHVSQVKKAMTGSVSVSSSLPQEF